MGKKQINYKVMTVEKDEKKLDLFGQEFYVDAGKKLPWLLPFITYVDETGQTVRKSDDLITDLNEIENYLESKFPPYIRSTEPRAHKVQLDVFQKFIRYLKKPKGSDDAGRLKLLNDELRKIDTFLMQNPGTFLSGDTITLPDCSLLPKLHHIRVAGKHYKQFSIPEDFTALQRYMEAADEETACQQCRPSDNEIIEGYKRFYGTE